jgi:glycosyltransferase involved in cell wall biosynthesis
MATDLIVFGEDWGGLPSSTQHLMQHLGKGRKILWINSIGLRKPRLTLADCNRAFKKITSRRIPDLSSLPISKPNFTVLNPTAIPAPSNRLERFIATGLLRNQLLPAIKKAQLDNPVLWISLPTASDLVGKLGERATVYYCGDDFSSLAGVDHLTVSAREQELQEKTDLIITASERLAERFPALKTRLLTHGVDYQLFSTPSPRATDLPADGKPIAGFYGSISEWLDMDLLVAVIKRMPHWNFILIGQAVVDTSALKSLENVYLVGPRPHHKLPEYSQHWNASLLPFKQNAQIQACNPLKLSEYLAAGKPVVSTPFPALRPYRKLISIADSEDSMIEALENSHLSGKDNAFSNRLRDSVSGSSWQAKADLVGQWLESI